MDINNIMVCPNNKIFRLYCYRVAGAVGIISLKIFGDYNIQTKTFGLYLAEALQITNILRDIKQDANRIRNVNKSTLTAPRTEKTKKRDRKSVV